MHSKLKLKPNHAENGAAPPLFLNGREDVKLVEVKVAGRHAGRTSHCRRCSSGRVSAAVPGGDHVRPSCLCRCPCISCGSSASTIWQVICPARCACAKLEAVIHVEALSVTLLQVLLFLSLVMR